MNFGAQPIRSPVPDQKTFKCLNCNKLLSRSIDLVEGKIAFQCPRCKAVLTISREIDLAELEQVYKRGRAG